MIVITEKTYRHIMIAIAVIAVALLPFWPYSSWGYLPTALAVAVVLALLAMQILARD